MLEGVVEVLSAEFAIGWVLAQGLRPAYVFARLDGETIGIASADLARPDLAGPAPQDDPAASILADLDIALPAVRRSTGLGMGFVMTFDIVVPQDRLTDVEVISVQTGNRLIRQASCRIDRPERLQLFVLGSPRSGTSEVSATLAKVLDLPWLGETHAAPDFAAAAKSLSGDPNSEAPALRFMATQSFSSIIVSSIRKLYYYLHSSASFLDKSPGLPTILAAPFLQVAFPNAKFIYMKRNGVSNVLSRMAKFGGRFDEHCADWAAAMTSWQEIRGSLRATLEIDQEMMLERPSEVARRIADFIELSSAAKGIAASLGAGSLERTGAGLRRSTLAESGWDDAMKGIFRRVAGPAMTANGYTLD